MFFQSSESGLFKEVADLDKKMRLKFNIPEEFYDTLANLVRPGHHVFIDPGITVKNLVAHQFTNTGS